MRMNKYLLALEEISGMKSCWSHSHVWGLRSKATRKRSLVPEARRVLEEAKHVADFCEHTLAQVPLFTFEK
jgi:hypothetical protein